MSAAIIPRPIYRRVAYDLRGLSWWRQLVEVARNPPRMELMEDWIVTLPGGLRIIVPRGFITDGASIPRLLWWLISPFGPLLEGAILHDFGYQYGYLLSPYTTLQAYNVRSHELRQEFADMQGRNIPVYVGRPQLFFDRLLKLVTIEANGASLQAWAAFSALRVFGDLAWSRYRAEGPAAYTRNSLYLPGVDSSGRAIERPGGEAAMPEAVWP